MNDAEKERDVRTEVGDIVGPTGDRRTVTKVIRCEHLMFTMHTAPNERSIVEAFMARGAERHPRAVWPCW